MGSTLTNAYDFVALVTNLIILLWSIMQIAELCVMRGYGMKSTLLNLEVLAKLLRWMNPSFRVHQSTIEEEDWEPIETKMTNGFSEWLKEVVVIAFCSKFHQIGREKIFFLFSQNTVWMVPFSILTVGRHTVNWTNMYNYKTVNISQ
jgi:hypothetical protein